MESRLSPVYDVFVVFFFLKFLVGMSSLFWVFIIHVFEVHQCGVERFFRVEVTNVGFKSFLGSQGLRARLCCRKISDSIFWLYYFTPR